MPEPKGYAELREVVSDQTARDIIEYRKTIRKPLTARAARSIANELALIPEAQRDAAVDHWLNKAWQGFKAEWFMKPSGFRDYNNPVKQGGSPKTFSDERDVPMAVRRAPLPESHFMNRYKQ